VKIILNLDSLNLFSSGLRSGEKAKAFIQELSDYLENMRVKKLNNRSDEIPIIEQIISNNKLTTGNRNSIIWKENNIILKYAKQNFKDEIMYFAKDNKKIYWLNNQRHYNNEVYTILKVQNNKIQEIEINKNNMPKEIGINNVFKKENDEYVLDKNATKELKEEITKMAEKVIEKQNKNFQKYRKEGHLYMVTEELGNNRFLKDLSNLSEAEFEEANIPQNLLDKAIEGTILKYNNGKYEYYSDYGYRLE